MKSNIFWCGYFFFLFFLFPSTAEELFLKGLRLPEKGDSFFDVMIRDGRIAHIAPHPASPPADAEILDFSGKWIFPGLIDLNCALFSSPGGGFSGEEFSETQLQKNQLSLLKAGITSIRVLNAPSSSVRKLKNRTGKKIGPRLFYSSPAYTTPSGYWASLYSEMESTEKDFWMAVTEKTDWTQIDFQEIHCLYVIASENRSQQTPADTSSFSTLSESLLSEIVRQAHLRSLPVIAYVETWSELQIAVRAGVQEIEGGPFLDATLPEPQSPEWQAIFEQMRQNKIRVSPQIYSFQAIENYPESLQKLDSWEKQIISSPLWNATLLPYSLPSELLSQKTNASTWKTNALQGSLFLKNQQIKVLAGSGAGDPLAFFGVSLHQQLQILHQAGWTLQECLDLVTIDAAETLGKSKELGKIQEGFLADLLILEENPLQHLNALKTGVWMYQNGQSHWIKQLDPHGKVGLKAPPLSSRFIDDFEDRNLLSPQQKNWDCFSDEWLGGTSQIQIQLKEGGAEKSLWSAVLSGQLAPASLSEPSFAGVEMNLAPEKEFAVDISAFTGIEFAAQGKGSFWIKLGTQNIYDLDYYAKEVRLTEEWTTYKIPFSEFHQQGFGNSEIWNPEDVTGIILIFYNGLESLVPISAQVDEFRFYQK